ncbi:MAG: universal stress protein [Nitrospirota bacterium]|nr:universal stress protein [Nitrospirota bacterium]MDH5767826.1 universal stress protein [Nitrospirota bacterium]
MKVLVAYDGTLHSKTALKYGLEKVKETGGELIALHVFNSSLLIDYDALPYVEERAKRETIRCLEEAKLIIKEEGKGTKACIIETEGNPEDEVIRCAIEENVDLLLCPTRYRTVVKTFKKMLNERGLETSIYAYGSSPYATVPSTK